MGDGSSSALGSSPLSYSALIAGGVDPIVTGGGGTLTKVLNAGASSGALYVYDYTSDTVGLQPGQWTVTLAQGVVPLADGITYNYPVSVLLRVGWEARLSVRDVARASVTSHWMNPSATLRFRTSVYGYWAGTSAATQAGGFTPVSFSAGYGTTPVFPSFPYISSHTAVNGGTPPSVAGASAASALLDVSSSLWVDYDLATSIGVTHLGTHTISLPQGTFTNGGTGLAAIYNAASPSISFLVGYVPTLELVNYDGNGANSTRTVEAQYNADRNTVTNVGAIPFLGKTFVVRLSYGPAFFSYGSNSAGLLYDTVMTWNGAVTPPNAPVMSNDHTIIYWQVYNQATPCGLYDFYLNDGELLDGTGTGTYNAAVRVSLQVCLPLLLLSGDATTPLTTRTLTPSGLLTGFTNSRAVRMRIYGTTAALLPFNAIFTNFAPVSNTSANVEALVNGRISVPIVVSTGNARTNYIEFALDVSAVLDGSYVTQMSASAPISDYYGNPVWQAESLGLWIDRTPPRATPQVYGTMMYVGDTFLVGGSPPGAAIPLPSSAMFSDSVSNTAHLLTLVSVVAVGDAHGLVPYTYQPPGPAHAVAADEGYVKVGWS